MGEPWHWKRALASPEGPGVTGSLISSINSHLMSSGRPQRDLVEVLLEAHVEARHVAHLAESLAAGSATPAAQETAAGLADQLEWLLPLHCQDEDVSVKTRLRGRHHRVDAALAEMQLQHLSLDAPMARVRLLCKTLARDIQRLHALRFELASAAQDLQRRLAAHHAFEEAAIFPALKRLLGASELDDITREMHERRLVAAA